VHWLTRLFRKDQAENQLDAELRFHLELQISDYIASGISPEEARRRTFLDFGGLESIKQQTRESRRGNFLEALLQDLRYAIRNLQKDRRFAMIAIFALALGIGASTIVFSIFYNLFFNAFAAKDANRLVVPVIQNTENTGQADSSAESLTLHLADLDVYGPRKRRAFACSGNPPRPLRQLRPHAFHGESNLGGFRDGSMDVQRSRRPRCRARFGSLLSPGAPRHSRRSPDRLAL
jgi:hypothetical protein